MLKDTFIFRCDIVDRLACYDDTEFRQIITAVADYVKYGEVPELPNHLMFAFNFIRVDIDSDKQKYDEVCRKNQEKAFRRWEKSKDSNDK